MSSINFKGKTVFITGAGSGIGYATALAFAAAGAAIVATDINQTGLDTLQNEMAALGASYRSEVLNVADAEAFEKLAERLNQEGSLPDIVINNAGIAYLDSFVNTTNEQWRRTLEINVLGVATGCRVFAKLWLQTGVAGYLVNIASGAAVSPMPNMAAYAASKYAVDGLCDVIALELAGSNIMVSCVYPGVINTAIVQHNDMMSISAEQVSRLQRHYVEHGVPPAVVATDILKGVSEGKARIATGPGTLLPPLMKRSLPRALFHKILLNAARKVGYL